MEMNNLLRFNPHRYEKHLSIFGKKVLHVMIKHWNTGRDSNNYDVSRHDPGHSKRTLTFRDSSCYIPNTASVTEQVIDSHSNFTRGKSNLSKNDLPKIPKSIELVKTVESNTEQELDSISGDDLVYPDYTNRHKNIVNNIYDALSDDDDNIKDQENKIRIGNSNKSKTSDIAWNDMFDTELLTVHSHALDHSQCVKINIQDETTCNIKFSNVNQNDNFNESIKTVAGETDNKNTTKRKYQSKITDTLAKKVKKTGVDKPKKYIRKLKYTKTVKNWLNDVNPANSVEEAETDSNGKGKRFYGTELSTKNIYYDSTNLKLNAENNINTNNVKAKNKKIVQAQLANKDGVMKFIKPKNHIENKTKEVHDTKNNMHTTENNKERTTKTKFVAPIKSHLTVKQITYNINIVDANNSENFTNEIFKSNDEEIAVALVYSNGYCQLNNHHTDDSCIPEGVLINIDNTFYYFKEIEETVLKILIQILRHNKIICYEGKNVLIYLQNMSVLDLGVHQLQMIDAKIGGSLLDPDNPPENFSGLQKLLNFIPQYTIATECVLQKSAWYMTLLQECMSKLGTKLVDNSLWNVFVNIEMKLLPIIADMERRGVSVDLEKLRSMEEILIRKLKTVEQDCYKAAGKTFQINSTAQVRAILYDELQLDTKCNVKIRETISMGAKSTSESMLRSLITVHPLPKLILEYRRLHKAQATFLAGIAQHVEGGIVRPTWVQTAAATGRIASNNPNLQAIPKVPFSLAMLPDTQDHELQLEGHQLSFRSVYIGGEGRSLLAADFRHVECRVLAHVAADADLLDALSSKEDLFRVLAAKWLKKRESDISGDDRERTKRIVYASLYGAGARTLMDILGISYEQTLAVTASFNRKFPCLKSFARSVVSQCEQREGRSSTLCGRARRFEHIASDDFALRRHAERQAVNFIVQGSAADICKLAMIKTEERLRSVRPPVEGHLVLQIHDELVWEIQDNDLDRAAVIIKQVMENCGQECGMSMSLPVAMSSGKSWGDLVEYTPSI